MTSHQGRITNIITVITVMAFVAELAFSRVFNIAALAGFIPARVAAGMVVPGALPVWLTPLSATLIHAGLLHIGLNLFMLLWCGRRVEGAIGGRALALLYVVGAYGAALGQWALDPSSTISMVGASGAISAVLAVYALVFSGQPVPAFLGLPPYIVRALWLGAAWIGLQAALGLATGGSLIAIGAHIGGFVTGLILARPLLRWRYREPKIKA